MPSRPITMAIIAFWLATAGWFVVRDIDPFLRAGEPPPFSTALSDEAQEQIVPTRWACTLNGNKIGTVGTGLTYRPADDTFVLQAYCWRMTFLDLTLPVVGRLTVSAEEFEDKVRVTRDGELREMQTAVTLAVNGPNSALTAQVQLSAEVRNGRLERHANLDVPGLGRLVAQLPTIDPPRGSVLNPMHPALQISGLRPGQTWRQPLADPRTDILRAALAQWLPGMKPFLPEPPAALAARVLPQPQFLEWRGETHKCLVVEYRDGEDYVARTWVRMSDGNVLRQEAGGHGETLVLQRMRLGEPVQGRS